MSTRNIVGLSASFGAAALAVAALVVSVIETRIMREEQHMAVWPRLTAATSRDDGGFNVVLQNKGLGPAQIRTVTVGTAEGLHQEWAPAFRSLVGHDAPNFYFSTIGGTVLMPGEYVRAVTMPRSAAADSLHVAAEALSLSICYCSAYDDCWWLTDPRIGAARSYQSIAPTESCDVPESDRFLM